MTEPVVDAPKKLSAPAKLWDIAVGEVCRANQFKTRSFDRINLQRGGEVAARDTLNSFLSNRGVNYRKEMSSPLTGETACSRISPYLAYGNISMRTVHQKLNERVDELKARKKAGESIEPTWLKSLSSYRSRLSWHCHFMQKLEDEPSIEFENFNRGYDGLRENEFNEEFFEAWCHGRTGYPMVDACMRALRESGWINFRMRAMLVSFASYHLWLHWRRPALHLARLFLDYEPGIHYSQIQMQSGVTGINTIRIYSPIKQATDQDPDGHFIKRYVPELADVPSKHIAQPHLMNSMEQTLFQCHIGVDYPDPIVDHKKRYQDARDRMHRIKRDPRTKEFSQQVFLKHGSRKTPMSRR